MRHNKLFAFIFLFSLSSVFGGWIALQAPSNEADIDAISFVSSDTGFIAQYWYLWRTTDGGFTFQNVAPTGIGSKINDIQFVDMNTGFLSHWGGNSDSILFTIWKTTDCGNSWNTVFTVPAFINCLFFLNPDCGYLVTQDDNNIYKTTDGGINWYSVSIPDNRVQTIYFLNPQTGFGLGTDRIWKTDNGGTSWRAVYAADVGVRFYQVYFMTNQIGYIAGERTDVRGNEREIIIRTADGGYTWEDIFKAHSGTEITSLFFTGVDTGYVATCKLREGNDVARIYKTVDGQDFFRIKLPLRRVEFIKPITFVKGTKTGYVFADLYDSGWEKWLFKTVDASGESLDIWQPLIPFPEKFKKGVLLTYDPVSYSLFLLEKRRNRKLWCYDIGSDSWFIKKQIPVQVKEGSMTYDGEGLSLIRFKSKEFWHYDIVNDSWLKLPNIPGETLVRKGACITSDWDSLVFVLKGGKRNEFWMFNRLQNQWQRKPDIPETPVGTGASIACDGQYVYALKGGKTNEMWSYNIEGQRWTRLPNIIGNAFKDGSCLASNPYAEERRFVFTLKGNTQECWYFDAETDFWRLEPSIPGKRKIKPGAQLTMDDENIIYAIKSKKQQEIWLNEQYVWGTGISEENEEPKFDENLKEATFDFQLSNPVNKLTLNIPPFDWISISVYDIAGRVIKEISSKENKSKYVSLGDKIPQGIYFISLKTLNGVFTQKIIITK